MWFKIAKAPALLAILAMLISPQGLSAEGVHGGFEGAFGQRFRPDARLAKPDARYRPRHVLDRAHVVRNWNHIAIDASGLDHTPVAPGEDRVFGEQLGPTRASRAMAIVHLAIFEAVNAVEGGYRSYSSRLMEF